MRQGWRVKVEEGWRTAGVLGRGRGAPAPTGTRRSGIGGVIVGSVVIGTGGGGR